MIKVMFVCHGNICRSPMGEVILNDMLREAGLDGICTAASCAVSREEIGNPIYPPAARTLKAHGHAVPRRQARQVRREDYDLYYKFLLMDESNLRLIRRFFPEDPAHKIVLLPELAGKPGTEVSDPWYTGDFEAAYRDIAEGCRAIVDRLLDGEML